MTSQIPHGSKTTFGTRMAERQGHVKQLSKNSVTFCCIAKTLKRAVVLLDVIAPFQERKKIKVVDSVLSKLYFFYLMLLLIISRRRISHLGKC